MKRIFTIFLFIFSQFQFAQINFPPPPGGNLGGRDLDDSFNNDNNFDNEIQEEISVELNGKTHYTDYKIFRHKHDSIVIDTTLTIKKEYRFNFLRKDNFELLQFHNQGQTFNTLAYDLSDFSLFPDIGFRAKQFGYMNVNDIKYFEVPTPTSEIMARTGLGQGQVVDALFTANFNRRLNFSFSYKGLRSLGHFRRSLSSTGNLRATLSYRTPLNQYGIRFHVAKQDFFNQESGGLTKYSLQYFRDNDKDFENRGRLDVNLDNTENTFVGTRVFFNHYYNLFSSKDSTNTKDFSNLKIGHKFLSEKKEYTFNQDKPIKKVFGKYARKGEINDKTESYLMNNQAYLEFNSKYVLGRFKVKANYTNVSYGYDTIINKKSKISKPELKDKTLSFGGEWQGKIKNFFVNADATIIPGNSHLSGNYFKGEAMYKKDSLFTIKARLSQVSKRPNFNFQLFQSVYNDYNWSNNFKNVATQNLGGSILSKWGNAHLDFSNIIDYAYFDEHSKPKQYDKLVTYFKLKVEKEFRYRKFALMNTILYQEVTSGADVFRVPKLITRNTLYYTDEWFKGKPLLVNIGLTFRYFTKYKMNAYNPLLAEFHLQNDTKIGFPMVDFFLNGRIRRARIFFKIDNLTSKWSKRDYFSAPNYPYRDFTIRFGVVWNWFI